jgi:hypothetical protein
MLFGNAIRHGKTVSLFTDTGAIMGEEYWQEGRLHGAWNRRHRDGTVAEQGDYLDGKRVGTWKSFARDGSLTSRVSFQGGAMHGTAEWTVPNCVLEFDHGQIVRINGRPALDPLGEALRVGVIKDQRLRDELAGPDSADFVDIPLRDIATYYSEVLDCPVALDQRALEAQAIDVDMPITFDSGPCVPAQVAIFLTLQPQQLVAAHRFEIIWITHGNEVQTWADKTGVASLISSPPPDLPPRKLAAIRQSLAETANVDFIGVPLVELLGHFAKAHRLQIACQDQTLQQINQSIYFSLNGRSVEATLSTLCEHLGARIRWQPDHTLIMELRDE